MNTTVTKNNGSRKLPFDESRLLAFIQSATHRYPHLDTAEYTESLIETITSKQEFPADKITHEAILKALDNVGLPDSDEGTHPDWTYVAAYVFLRSLYKAASKNRVYDASQKYGDFYALIKTLSTQGIYSPDILRLYSKDEINEFGREIEPERDKLFNYIGLKTLADRYLAKSYDGEVYELPQERFMIITMTLMMHERKDHRADLVKEAYWALSNLYMTVATPTLANAGLSFGQLSSCFIDTVDDSLRSIYDSNTDVAMLSKNGGGIGVYVGKLRARGSDIKGFKGVSSGVIPWVRQLNNTAVSVDQLGRRKGSIAVYLDVWHKDILSFLDLKLNNGDERLRAHDIFPGVCIPDLFIETVRDRGDWYLFDPHEVRRVMRYSLEDFYDEKKGEGSFRQKYEECVDSPELGKVRLPAIEIMKSIMKSQIETGTPYMFYRDEANRMNPNGHAGMIYCTNLCTEIMQNMSPTVVVKEHTDKDGDIITTKIPGDFVVCNLSSINLARAYEVLDRLIPIQVRMLDNVIDINADKIEVQQAVVTNKKYRAIGLGTFGWHHLLAVRGIQWESEEAVTFANDLYEKIAYLTIRASCLLAAEKGPYPAYEVSDWSTGDYFIKRGYARPGFRDLKKGDLTEWEDLADNVTIYGIRNGYLMAVAPNMSTAKIGGSTDGIDPIFMRTYSEEKSKYKIPVTVPGLSSSTMWLYKSAFNIDQSWSIRQNAARQKHIDQGVSFNLYVSNGVKAKDLLGLHMLAWEFGLKSTYYLRSATTEIEECEACSS
ncbi:ribonucleoside-diphosphate reductase subunit alpha [Paenibacillus larvae]|uniref:ribonucleoside-diphosphate reductase subunit alpha n=1 Tax=Paenibacillus larvae TaxID=1464 RepID=UPI0015555028|nr:ribonucleoside-diphosphate reductase subunit alpha [Paenibacillus larvae]